MLVFDIGNSSMSVALYQRGESAPTRLFKGNHCLAEIADTLGGTLPRRAVVASVEGEKTALVLARLKADSIDVLCLNSAEHDIVPHRLMTPETTGLDRLCAARGAWERMGRAGIIIDAGTAVTVDAVDAVGFFLGGAILPGAALWLDALQRGTARLPHLSPQSGFIKPIGDSTVSAIQAGVAYGLAGAVDRLVGEYRLVIAGAAQVLLTGGGAPALLPRLDCSPELVDDLVITGAHAFATAWWGE